MTARRRTIQALDGQGIITGAGIEDVPGRYSLRINQELHLAGGEELPGLYNVTGTVEPLGMDPFVLMSEGNLVLQLEDGRKMGFFLKNLGGEIALTDAMTLLEGLDDGS